MLKELKIPLFDLVSCLSNAMDMVNPLLVDHHKQVAYIAFRIARELGFSQEQQQELVLAGFLHDIGALSSAEKLQALHFEFDNPQKHAELGYLLLKMHKPFSSISLIIRYHHTPWQNGKGTEYNGHPVPFGSHILYLADRVAISVDRRREILDQVSGIMDKITSKTGELFPAELVDALKSLADKEYFWCDVTSNNIGPIINRVATLPIIEQGVIDLLSLARVFAHIIDFRSRFTATHSSGVAATATALARFAMFNERECDMMTVAGYLHDLGKLAVPAEVLEKPGKLTDEEYNLMRHHTYLTYRALQTINGLETINNWASFHHERINGNGYPFHQTGEELPLGSRIMAVADVFTAITEDRPYRKGMSDQSAIHVLQQMADGYAIDANVVTLLREHFDDINNARKTAQAASKEEYEHFMSASNT
ncbi:MAG: HD domain-containing protein [Dehalococcoidia bacterium]|nr:HD domain-containing protein [Dehalococcoidia bacterium]